MRMEKKHSRTEVWISCQDPVLILIAISFGMLRIGSVISQLVDAGHND